MLLGWLDVLTPMQFCANITSFSLTVSHLERWLFLLICVNSGTSKTALQWTSFGWGFPSGFAFPYRPEKVHQLNRSLLTPEALLWALGNVELDITAAVLQPPIISFFILTVMLRKKGVKVLEVRWKCGMFCGTLQMFRGTLQMFRVICPSLTNSHERS